MNVLQLISSDNFIAVNKTLIKAFGNDAAILLGELASESTYWENRTGLDDGYFYSTIENVEERTALSPYQQRKALELLKEKGVVDVISKKGSPPKRYIRINEESLAEFFNFQTSKNFTYKNENSEGSKVKKINTKNKELNKNHKEQLKEVIESFPFKSDEFVNAIQGFVEMRQLMKKPLTPRALKMLINKAVSLSNSNEGVMVELFNQSTSNGWLGIYPLKNNYSYSNGRNTRQTNGFMDMLEELANDEEGDVAGANPFENSLSKYEG